MSRTILRAELKHLRRMLAPLDRGCPVCAAEASMLKKPYPVKKCATNNIMTACSPSVQKRCRKLMPLMDKMATALFASIVAIKAELGDE